MIGVVLCVCARWRRATSERIVGKRHSKRQYPDNWSRCRACGAIYTLGERHECEENDELPSPEPVSDEDGAEENEDPELSAWPADAGLERQTPQR